MLPRDREINKKTFASIIPEENKKTKLNILIFAFNRPEKLERVLRAVCQNFDYVRSVQVIVDCPNALSKSFEKDAKLKSEVIEVINSYRLDYSKHNGLSVNFKEREHNYGLAKNIIHGITSTFENSEQIEHLTILEDDIVPTRLFFKYMSFCLENYKDIKEIKSICGYTYPTCQSFPFFGQDVENIKIEMFLAKRFIPWGWSTWKTKWSLEHISTLLARVAIHEEKDTKFKIPPDIKRYLEDERFYKGEIDIWSILWSLEHYLNQAYTIHPSFSLVENIGFDGTGVHSEKTEVFNNYFFINNSDHSINPVIEISENRDMLIEMFLFEHSKKVMLKQVKEK